MRLIDATKLEEIWRKQKARDQYNGGGYLYSPQDILDDIEEAETIDPASLRPNGEWEDCDWVEYDGHGECIRYPHKGCVCTNCRNAFKKEFVSNPRVNYCPNCGAKMGGGTRNE